MTKKELVRIIREVVKRELKNVLTENKKAVQPKKKKQYTKNTMLNEVLIVLSKITMTNQNGHQ